ncbi:glucosaminidase domain-containing protein [Halomonas denitrificans]|nr:glucosaminidase domain-containing protein [Halomonas denitrificans]
MNAPPTETKRETTLPSADGGLHLGHGLVAFAALLLVTGALVLGLRPAPGPLPDFDLDGPADARKQAFFEFLAPLVREENARVAAQRERLLALEARLEAGQAPGWWAGRWLRARAIEYELEADPERTVEETVAALKLRIDTVPPALAMVQAAAESAWGRSRFARQANNLFGQWCYEPGCGMVPRRRSKGARHEVAAFESPRQSVRRYLHNLNTHPAYAPLRRIRAGLREAGEPPRALALADGLIRYSERRQAYVDEIKAVIRTNRPLIDEALARVEAGQ